MSPDYGAAAPDANPELASCFLIEIDGIALSAFKKVRIGDSEWALGEDRTGVDGLAKQTFSGLRKAMTIEFEKNLREGGADDIKQFDTWHGNGSKDRRDGSIVYLDRDGAEVLRYNFVNGWISKISFPEGDATADNADMLFKFTLSVSGVSVG